MKSIIEKWALEGKNKDGTPNGVFWMDRAGATKCAEEVLANNVGMEPSKIGDHMK